MNNVHIDFEKYEQGLIPAIIQDAVSADVLMLGYMNREALAVTQETGKVTFYSRSKRRLWTKGETSGNFLELVSMVPDCDKDALLLKVKPKGAVCHTGSDTCFGPKNSSTNFLPFLEAIIADRISNIDVQSYVSGLYREGINKIAQKVGEEAVELIIEAKDNQEGLFKNEAADLLFHYLVLLQAKGCRLKDIEGVLKERNEKSGSQPQ